MNSDWQCQCTQINKRGLHLLQNEKWSDCRFLVGIEPNQRIISGHKLILAMSSPVFECMFYGQMADKSDPILIPDVQPEAFSAMMEYIYSDHINVPHFDAACELCYVAKKYMLPHVVDYCMHFLWSDVNPSNACRAYEFAKLFEEPRLVQKSMALMVAFTREVINDSSFLDIETSTLMDILNQEKLNIESELDLFNAINRLANARGVNHTNTNGNQNSGSESSGNVPVNITQNATASEEASSALAVSSRHENNSNITENNETEENNNNVNGTGCNILEGRSSNNTNEGGENSNVIDTSVVVSSVENVTNGENILDTDIETNHTFAADNTNTANTSANTYSTASSGSTTTLTTQNAQGATNVNSPVNETSQRPPIPENVLRAALKKIRFLTMTPQQFAEGPALSNLLQQKEALAIFIRISSSHVTDYPMPEGFSTSRVFRNFFDSQRLGQRLQRHELLNNSRHGANASGMLNNTTLSQSVLPLVDTYHPSANSSGSLSGRLSYSHTSSVHPFLPDINGNRLSIPMPPDPEEVRRRFGIRNHDPPFDLHPTTQSDRRHLRSSSSNNNHILLRIL